MQLLAFGDSITWGSYTAQGWAEKLRLFMWEKEDTDDVYRRVYGLGIPGNTTDDLVERFFVEAEARIEEKYGEVILLFAFGSNDCALAVDEQKVVVPLDQYIENLEKVCDYAAKWSPKIFLLTAPPVVFDGLNKTGKKSRTNKDIDNYNQALMGLAERKSYGLINVNTAFKTMDLNQLFIDDGLHPNGNGHQLIFEEVKRALTALVD